MILFAYDIHTGHVVQVLAAESWLQDPGRPIPEDVSRLTGITNEDVRGQSINEDRVRELATDVKLIIAHNASFDRPFIDRRLPFLADTHWGCSMNDVSWQERGLSSRKLEILLYAHTNTFLDTHHRALDDCRATLHVLANPFSDGRVPLQLLLTNCRTPRVRVAAVNSHFDTKDLLRQRGYAWTGDKGKPPKTWCREVVQPELDAELQWLREQVYLTHPGQPTIEKIDLRRRYGAA
jgi:DNA polymerase III subunit epsilon